jgi:hypothetical protein
MSVHQLKDGRWPDSEKGEIEMRHTGTWATIKKWGQSGDWKRIKLYFTEK